MKAKWLIIPTRQFERANALRASGCPAAEIRGRGRPLRVVLITKPFTELTEENNDE